MKKLHYIPCPACGGTMGRGTLKAPLNERIMALAFMLMGLGLCLTCIGAIVGVPFLAVAGKYAGKARKVWRCPSCGHTIDRS